MPATPIGARMVHVIASKRLRDVDAKYIVGVSKDPNGIRRVEGARGIEGTAPRDRSEAMRSAEKNAEELEEARVMTRRKRRTGEKG
jgi:hypothetical protein